MTDVNACACTKHSANPLRGRFNSWLFSVLEEPLHEVYKDRKEALFADLSGTVVEIGPGNGANFRYYPKDIELICIEPNPYMHARLKQTAAALDLDIQLKSISGERLELESNSADAVVGTLVMCTVPNARQAIEEVLRVLKPGAQYRFIEHVAAEPGSALRRLQEWIKHPWRWLFEGCCTNRETGELFKQMGFTDVQFEQFKAGATPAPVALQIFGRASK